MLREYVYLDRNRIEDFLSQLEGGVSDTTRQSETAAAAAIEGGLNVGIARLGSTISGPSISQEDLRRTTDVALFERLYTHLEQDELERVTDPSDVQWGQLRQGMLLELEGSAVVSGLAKMTQMLGEMQALAPFIDESMPEGAEGLGALFGGDIGVRYELDETVVAYSTLDAASLRSQLRDIEGECTALVRVRKSIRKGKRTPLRTLGGIKLDVPQLEAMLGSFAEVPPELGFKLTPDDVIATGPSVIATTVAVYR